MHKLVQRCGLGVFCDVLGCFGAMQAGLYVNTARGLAHHVQQSLLALPLVFMLYSPPSPGDTAQDISLWICKTAFALV